MLGISHGNDSSLVKKRKKYYVYCQLRESLRQVVLFYLALFLTKEKVTDKVESDC